jgi:hypothetical protein
MSVSIGRPVPSLRVVPAGATKRLRDDDLFSVNPLIISYLLQEV